MQVDLLHQKLDGFAQIFHAIHPVLGALHVRAFLTDPLRRAASGSVKSGEQQSIGIWSPMFFQRRFGFSREGFVVLNKAGIKLESLHPECSTHLNPVTDGHRPVYAQLVNVIFRKSCQFRLHFVLSAFGMIKTSPFMEARHRIPKCWSMWMRCWPGLRRQRQQWLVGRGPTSRSGSIVPRLSQRWRYRVRSPQNGGS
jgi:hypothetical protein